MSEGVHIPVLLSETIDALCVKAGGRYVDGTLGRAGHASEIAARGGEVLGIDRDEQALSEVSARRIAGVKAVKGRHGDLRKIAEENGWYEIDGILLDLGVSSPQLDEAGRGFSFLREGPLDMRMDRSEGVSAAELVATAGAEELERIFRDFGEERAARRVARAIAAECAAGRAPKTTLALANLVERVAGRHGAHHPATRVFQALRMAVNDEVGELERALEGGLAILKPGGRFAVISFESITDRIVKRFFAAHVGRMVSLQQGGAEWQGELPRARAVLGGGKVATAAECEFNPRSRSARLRVIEKE